MPRRKSLVLLAGAGAVAAPAWLELQRRIDRARILADPEHAALSRPPQGRRLRVESADGTRLNVEVFGREDAPTVVLVHGWTCALRFWIHQIGALSRTLRVVAYDQRGHGQSDPAGSAGYTTDALASDLDAVLAAGVHEGRRAVVAGHSMGAMTIVSWASRFPGDVERRSCGAALISTGMGNLLDDSHVLPMPRPLHPLRRALARRLIALQTPTVRALSPISFRTLRYLALTRGASPAQVAFCEDMYMQTRRTARARWGQALATLDLYADVTALRVPTLVMVGERDRLTPVSHATYLERSLPLPVGLVEVPGVGHMAPLEAAPQVTRALSDFALARLAEPVPAA